jgi:hypothetical protein
MYNQPIIIQDWTWKNFSWVVVQNLVNKYTLLDSEEEESCLLPSIHRYEPCHGCADALMSGQPGGTQLQFADSYPT